MTDIVLSEQNIYQESSQPQETAQSKGDTHGYQIKYGNTELYQKGLENALKPSLFFHKAAEVGDCQLIRSIFDQIEQGGQDGTKDLVEQEKLLISKIEIKRLLSVRDIYDRLPIHYAILKGQTEALELLLKQGSPLDSNMLNSLQLTIYIASLPKLYQKSLDCLQVLLSNNIDINIRDYLQRHVFHWICVYDLAEFAQNLIKAYFEQQKNVKEDEQFIADPATLQDYNNDTPVHLAARFNSLKTLQLFLENDKEYKSLSMQNKQGNTPLHLAGMHNHVSVADEIIQKIPSTVQLKNKHGQTALQLTLLRGHKNLVELLTNKDLEKIPNKDIVDQSFGHKQTLIIAPKECEQHLTCLNPDNLSKHTMPNENLLRLKVLTQPDFGILNNKNFQDQIKRLETLRPVTTGDLLRVHDWNYVSSIKKLCETCEESLNTINTLKLLDSDTIISRETYKAALYAAGSVIEGIDQVMAQKVKNVFCAVRPPGHHAGMVGKVQSDPKREGDSNGFCIFNNIAIGAAYALSRYRDLGIQKVAIVDFDVHHGNGTEDIVIKTQPTEISFDVKNLFGQATYTYPIYKPWLDSTDQQNIFLAGTQGYGLQDPLIPQSLLYPGTGSTEDNKRDDTEHSFYYNPQNHLYIPKSGITGNKQLQIKEERKNLVEDPDHEFKNPSHAQTLPPNAPRIINVGIPGPGNRISYWKRAWRDKILPALVNFSPDFIFISAGFDAHKKDTINHHFVGIQEREYEWLTDQLVQVANRCCKGRIVSVLEGGYAIEGGPLSPFARSVASHVQSLKDLNNQLWSPQEGQMERKAEKLSKILKEKQQALSKRKEINENQNNTNALELHDAEVIDVSNIIDGPRQRRKGITYFVNQIRIKSLKEQQQIEIVHLP